MSRLCSNSFRRQGHEQAQLFSLHLSRHRRSDTHRVILRQRANAGQQGPSLSDGAAMPLGEFQEALCLGEGLPLTIEMS
jgi:hypothetical protein